MKIIHRPIFKKLVLSYEQNFTESTLNKLFESSNSKTYRKGATIYQEGEKVKGIYRVVNGRVKLWKMGSSYTRSLILYFVFPEDPFGLIDLFIRERERRSSATTMDHDTTIEFVPIFEVERFLRREPKICLEISVFLKKNYNSILERYAELQSQNIHNKVLKAIRKIANERGTPVEGGFLLKTIKHQDLSDYIGLSRQSVTQSFNYLKEKGKIDYDRQQIFVKNSKQ